MQSAGQIRRRVFRHDATLINNHDLFTCLSDFWEDVCAEDDRMVTGQFFDQFTSFNYLFGVEPSGRFIENEYVRVVQNSLCKTNALAVTL